jgi:hypothetical protein
MNSTLSYVVSTAEIKQLLLSWERYFIHLLNQGISISTYINNTVTLVRERTIPTKRSQHVGEVSANVRATDPHGRILDFLDRSRYYFF